MIGRAKGQHLKALVDRANAAGIVYSDTTYDESSDMLVVRNIEDVQPIIDLNKEQQNSGLGYDGWTKSKNMRRMASIPPIVAHQWLMEGINVYRAEDWPKVRQRLNDPAWSDLRTAPGRI